MRPVDENLIWSELTAVQHAEYLAKRKELWEARKLAGTIFSTKKPQNEKGFATETAVSKGTTCQQVNRAVFRAKSVTDESRGAVR